MLRHRLMRGFVASLTIAAVLLTVSVDAGAVRHARDESATPDREIVSEVTRISELWAKEWSAKNLDAVIALYTEDAVFLPSTGSRITGRAAIRELFAGALASHSSELHVRSKATEQSGHLAFDSGEYEETSTAGGIKRSGRGNYLVVLRREGKNQWHIVQHMWTDLPSAGQ